MNIVFFFYFLANPIKLPTGGGSISTHLGKRAVDPNQFKKPNRDIVFVLDTSGSVPMDAFERAKESIAILNKAFCPTKFGAETDGRKQVKCMCLEKSQK